MRPDYRAARRCGPWEVLYSQSNDRDGRAARDIARCAQRDGPSLMMGPLLCRTLGHHDARRGDVDQTTMLRAHVARHMRADPRGGKIDAGLLVAMSLAQFDGRRFTIDAGLGGELTVALQAPLDADDGSGVGRHLPFHLERHRSTDANLRSACAVGTHRHHGLNSAALARRGG